jgi:uncharacterized protein (DUF1330 family)
MSAYLISQVQIIDPAAWEKYREIAAPAIAKYGGRYLARGVVPEVVEGDWPVDQPPEQQVIVAEFPDIDALHRWYSSKEYAPALEYRRTAVKRRLLFVRGVDEVLR